MNILKTCLTVGILLVFPVRAIAQITPDGSTSTTVDNNGSVSTINEGNRSGANLFHSFDGFSVPNGNEAFFNNAADVDNIFSRVTGGNVSNIDGLIRANDANLFLINPAGVIFGGGARLDLGGAFYGGSADSILFPDGVEFSANDAAAPVLTINAPIGLNFRDEPATVSVQSNNLSTAGQNFNLFGGDINFDGGIINALGNNINLGAVSSAGTVVLDENLNLDFSNISLADIAFSNSQLNVNGNGGGEVSINARNVNLSNSSTFSAGINSDSSTAASAGNITINATETLALDSGSIIRNNISQTSTGDAGNIFITAQNLSLADNSRLSTISVGNGNTGNITLNIAENTSLSGTAEIKSEISEGGIGDGNDIQINSGSLSLTNDSKVLADVQGSGNGGDIIINVNTLDLNERSDFSTNLSGQGNAGSVNIQASESVTLRGSTFQTRVLSGAEGNAGSVDINTNSLVLSNDASNPAEGSRILASTGGTGNAGDINVNSTNVSLNNDSSIQTQVESTGVGNAGNISINTTDLFLTNGTRPNRSSLLANSIGEGDGGDITINALGNISLDTFGLILSQGTGGSGDAGDISITSDTLSLSMGSVIISTTGDPENLDVTNAGDAGNIDITSRITTLDRFSGISTSSISNAVGEVGDVTLNSDRLTIRGNSGISALTENAADGGTIEVNAANLDIFTGGGIVTLTNGAGNAGDINLNIEQQVTIDGANPLIPPEEFRSPLEVERELETETGLFANTTDISTGSGGNVQITNPETVSIFNSGQITVDSEGTGNGGNLSISAGSLTLNNQSQLIARTQVGQEEQRPSNIDLQIESILSLQGDSQISAQAFNNANGGNVTIDADFVVAFAPVLQGNDIIANAREGAGGRIDITAQEIFGLQEGTSELDNASNDLDVSSDFGFDGNISINTPDVDAKAGVRNLPTDAINPEENVQQVCSASNASGTSSLSLQGRGGIPAPPTNTLSSDNILSGGELSQANQDRLQQNTPKNSEIALNDNASGPSGNSLGQKGIATAQGKIIPARGIAINNSGEVMLISSAKKGSQEHSSSRFSQCLAK